MEAQAQLACNISSENPIKVLIYTHDAYGLGNARRMLSIAQALTERHANLHVLMITGSPRSQLLPLAPRIELLKLPHIQRNHSGHYQPAQSPLNLDELVHMRADIIRSTLLNYTPHLVLVDKKPLGMEGELKPMLETLGHLPNRPGLALVLRDILDSPEVTRQVWQRNNYHDVLQQYYDLVLVAGQPEIFDLAREYQFPIGSRKLIRYCGYIRHQDIQAPSAASTHSDSNRLLIAVGGGDDGYAIIHNYLQGIHQGLGPQAMQSLIITGPNMPANLQDQLKTLARPLAGHHLVDFCPNMPDALRQSDLVLGMCGYNSMCEALALGKRVLAIPRTKPVAEQWIRAQRLHARGLLNVLHPDELSPKRLMHALEQAFKSPPPQVALQMDFGGLERIGYWLDRLLSRHASTASNIHPLSEELSHA